MEIQEKPFDLLHYSDNPPIQKKIPQKQKARKSKKKKPTVSKSDSQHSQKFQLNQLNLL